MIPLSSNERRQTGDDCGVANPLIQEDAVGVNLKEVIVFNESKI
jgi:hypothetical protein